MTRFFNLSGKETVKVGMLAQAPQGDSGYRVYENLTIEKRTVKNIRCDLKMEIGHTIVMIANKLPDCRRMGLFTVKGTIHKFNLRHALLQEEGKFFFYCIKRAKAKLFIN